MSENATRRIAGTTKIKIAPAKSPMGALTTTCTSGCEFTRGRRTSHVTVQTTIQSGR